MYLFACLMDSQRYPDLRLFLAEQRNKDIEMSCESLVADLSRLRNAQMSSWSETFHDFSSLNCTLDGVLAMWDENRLFQQDDTGELSRRIRDVNFRLNELRNLLLKMCEEKDIHGLDMARERANAIRNKAGDEFVALPHDYTDW